MIITVKFSDLKMFYIVFNFDPEKVIFIPPITMEGIDPGP